MRKHPRATVIGLLFMLFATAAHADDSAFDPGATHIAATDFPDLKSYVLASSDRPAAPKLTDTDASASPATEHAVKDPLFSTDKLHEYLGLGTIILAAATAITAPEGCEGNCTNNQPMTSGTHQNLGRATRAMALSALATGLLFHWDDMHLFEDGIKDPDTQHWLLAGGGALLLANAVSKAPASSHSTQAELGALMMLVGIKITW